MKKEETKEIKIKEIEGIEHLMEGAKKFSDLILSMKEKLKAPNTTIVFISGMAGYSCQAAMLEKKQSYNLVKTTNGKNYIFGDSLNYFLIESQFSFYNILMGQYKHKLPDLDIIDVKPFLVNVAGNVGNEKYLIKDIFNPETIFDFEFYRSTWKNFSETLKKYCKTVDEWPLLFSLAMINFLDIIDSIYGRDCYIYFTSIALENAIYVSKISQL